MTGVEYGVTCGAVRLCDRPRGHGGDHGAWVDTTAERLRAPERARYAALVEAARHWKRAIDHQVTATEFEQEPERHSMYVDNAERALRAAVDELEGADSAGVEAEA